MRDLIKPAELLKVSDFKDSPVWESVNDDAIGESCVRPYRNLPATNFTGMLVGDKVQLANGQHIWGFFGNVCVNDPRAMKHMLSFSAERKGKWFGLARYQDFNWDTEGPSALATFLGLAIDEVFPISFDIRRFAQSHPLWLAGSILKEPEERLTTAQLMEISLTISRR